MKTLLTSLCFAVLAIPASAAVISVSGPLSSAGGAATIIAAPTSVADDLPGAENTAMQAFNEVQGFTLLSNLAVDGGSIAAGTKVDSHMIFLNSNGSTRISHGLGQAGGVQWTFSGTILGVMSNSNGSLEAASNSFLGAPGTAYPGSFGARGLEGNPFDNVNDDFYSFAGKVLTIGMQVTEPGDWVRVVTASPAPVPLPAAGWLMIAGLGALGAAARRRRAA